MGFGAPSAAPRCRSQGSRRAHRDGATPRPRLRPARGELRWRYLPPKELQPAPSRESVLIPMHCAVPWLVVWDCRPPDCPPQPVQWRARRCVTGCHTEIEKPLTQKMLAGWQAALFPTGRSGLTKIRVGVLRGESPMRIVSGPIGRQRVHYEAPPRRGLEHELKRLLTWFNKSLADVDGLLRAPCGARLVRAYSSVRRRQRAGRPRPSDRALGQDENRSSRLYSVSARFMAVRNEYYERCKSSLAAISTLRRG